MKSIVVLAVFAAVAAATPSSETDGKLFDIIGNIVNNLNRPPISMGPAIIGEESPISVGPALVEEESPISVGPVFVEEESPISVGPALVEEEDSFDVAPVIVDENLADDAEFPDVISTLPAMPVDDSPITIDIPGLPAINIVINVNPPAQQYEEIEPTPIIVVDDFEAVDDEIEPTPVIVVDEFVPDPDIYY